MNGDVLPTAENDAPTPDEIARVGRYWARVKDLLCKHEMVTFCHGEPPTCGTCGRPVRLLSDVQIEDLRPRVIPPGVTTDSEPRA